MAGIRSGNTKPEITVRKLLHGQGFRFRLNRKIGKVRPDIILPRYRTCIFVHGCFWHRHENCKLAGIPKSNTAFWEEKFAKNVKRDAENIAYLQSNGWQTGIIWECAVRNGSIADVDLHATIGHLAEWEIGGV